MPRRTTWVLWLLALVVSACEGLPIPRLVFDTPAPRATPAPSPTPLAAGTVTFTVRVPANTPAGSAPAVQVLDPVTGQATTVVLTQAGANQWSGSTTATLDDVLRYKYVRPLPSLAEEETAAGEPVPFRLVAVSDNTVTADDSVATWSDQAFAGDVGSVEGRVWNGNVGQGVMGVLVAAGGQLAVTGHDGSFVFFGLPAGSQRVTALAPDGSLRPAQQSVSVSPGQMSAVDLVSVDPNAVHLTFLVRPPAGADARAVLRLAGNVWQLGDTFVPGAGFPAGAGASVAAARQPTLVPLADGRWTVTLQLYEGTLLKYRYTLGDGAWNGEMDGSGRPLVRQLVVPGVDRLVDDSIASWRQSSTPSITFEALTPADTPATDSLAIQFRTERWLPPLPMWRVSANDWRFVLYNQGAAGQDGTLFYRYCRNFACGTADDAETPGDGATGRFFTPAIFAQNLRDDIRRWEWLSGSSGSVGDLPPMNAHLNFAAGADFDDNWQPGTAPFLAQTFSNLLAGGANWVSFTRRGQALQMQPLPAYGEAPALAPLPVEWANLVSTAHSVGLRVALHPVTCPYTPYGICDYWNGVNFGGSFWNDWFAAYERYLLTQAELARQTGTDLLVVGDFKLRPALPGEAEAPPDAEVRWRSLISKVRAVYRGQLAFELLMGEGLWPSPPPFLDAVDVIRVWWWSPLSALSNPNPADLASAAGALMDAYLLPLQQRFNRPIHLSAAYLSADGAATQCLRRADGQCHSFEDFAPSAPDASTYVVDLQEQADIYTGLLTALNSRGYISGFSTYGYHPAVTLRDKSLSVRGKPAEAVLAAWFPKLQGR